MALMKISDLPGLSPENRFYTQERFKQSLMEVSYCLSQDISSKTYVSRYMTVCDFLSGGYLVVPPGEISLCSIYQRIADLSSQISSALSVIDNLESETWTFYPTNESPDGIKKQVYALNI